MSAMGHDQHEYVEGIVTNTDWQGDIADIVTAIWMEKLEPGIFITVDDVQPEMAKRGYNLTRRELGDAMGVVAADNNWGIGVAADGTVQVKPF
jgi:hypothetical protein